MTIGLNVLSREFQESLYKPETHYKSSQSSISAAIPREAPADNSVPDKKLSARKVEGVNVAERIFALIVDSLYICYRTLQIIGHTINIMVRRGSPVSIQQAADGLGGVFLKLLQFICSSETMAQKAFGENHEAYIKALRHVTSNNKQMSTGQLVKCLKDAGIDYHPDMLDDRLNLGTGSIGEVNEIYTMEGQSQDINLRYKTEPSIIVKVVLPANETKILSDIKLINLLMKMVSFFAPKMLASGLKASLTDFIESFKSELNLETEAENTLNQARVFDALPNCEKFTITDEELLPVTSLYLPPDTRMLEDLGVNIRFKVPKVDTRYTTQKTMVMQRVDGVTLTASDENDE
ncbi:MAG: AarF/UbiB family protein, partial [Endozoicomonas sp.]